MNELSLLRGLRADAPLPDADRLAAPRARLAVAFRQETRPERAAFPRRRMILIGAATAGTLAVTTTTAGIIAIHERLLDAVQLPQEPAGPCGPRHSRHPDCPCSKFTRTDSTQPGRGCCDISATHDEGGV